MVSGPHLPSIFGATRKRPLFQRIRLLEAVVTQARDAIVITEAEPVTGPGPRIVYVNPAFTARTSYTAQEVLGKTPRILQGPETDPASLEKIHHALRAWQPIEIELINYRKDGSKHWVEISIVPVADETGFFTNWISVQRDLTERKAIYESLTLARIGEAQATTLAIEAQQRTRLEEQLAVTAIRDDLTGLRNRRSFIRILREAVDRASSEKHPGFSLMTLNIDRFRSIAASGNETGNAVLREVASRLRSALPSSAVIARLAGDEYAVLFEDRQGSDAHALGDEIIARCAQPMTTPTGDVSIALSIGVTSFSNDLRDEEMLIRDSGTALQRVKRQGGGILTFTDSMEAEASQATRIYADLRVALEREEFALHYQPIVDVTGGRVAGFEALLRWNHPTRGLVPPLHFIPYAEEAGLIVPIGAWVLKRACEAAVRWQADVASPLSMSVNVTSQQLLDEDFYPHLCTVLAETRLAPELLQLEVTESVLLAGPAVIGPLFERIRGLGVKIAFDDFGTGYSSLSYLERFQIDTLKIDKSFVDRMDDAYSNSEIVRMIMSLAHALGLKVIAEGIEVRAQCEALSQLGCTEMQGYLFSKPIPEECVAEALRTNWSSHPALNDVLEGRSSAFHYDDLCTEKCDELMRHVTAAIDTHHKWLARLSDAVESGVSEYDIATVALEDQCSIGIWLQNADPELRVSPLYAITRARHAVFHRSAAKLLSLALKRDPRAQASLAPGGDFRKVASLMLRALEDWFTIAKRVRDAGDPQPALERSAVFAGDRVPEFVFGHT